MGSQSLVDQLLGGSYAPSMLAKCDGALPVDQNPHCIRFAQFYLFSEPRSRAAGAVIGPAYMVLHHNLAATPTPDQRAKQKEAARQFVLPLLPVRRDLQAGTLPSADDPKTTADKLRLHLCERKVPGYCAGLADDDVRREYAEWLRSA